jgi:hypothetical protein
MQPSKFFGISRSEWTAMSFYARFEQIVTWLLTLLISIIIAIALFRLILTVFQLLVFRCSKSIEPRGIRSDFRDDNDTVNRNGVYS